jgi:UDP-N-acetylglucosamine 4,6-dehydratase/5-epimerase
MSFSFKNKIVVITGGGGTIGVPLAQKLLDLNVKTVRLFDQDDSALTFAGDVLKQDKRIRLFLGKIEDKDRLLRAFQDADVVFHLAAIKHVMVSEYNPYEAVSVNIIGTENVLQACLEKNVSKLIFASTDKAVNPINTYGSSKQFGERLVTAANLSRGSSQSIFSTVRFGNVIGSRGSVIPRFKEQLINFNKIRVTKEDMTRFIMFLDNAVSLLIESCKISKGGEVFVLKMIPIKLGDLVDCVLEYYSESFPNASKEEIGLFKGEKDYEELLDIKTEENRTVEMDTYYLIIPAYSELSKNFTQEIELASQNKNLDDISSEKAKPISKTELYNLLIENKAFK